MKRADRKRWTTAASVPELGELTAMWLEGKIGHPGYYGGPDDETLPHVPTLAAINRAGFVTYGSQPGVAETGFDGAWWEQRAAVEGFATRAMAERLGEVVARDDLLFICDLACAYGTSHDRAIPVSKRETEPTCSFGCRFSGRAISEEVFGGLTGPAIQRLGGAIQVTIVDPEWGRNDRLWERLDLLTATANA